MPVYCNVDAENRTIAVPAEYQILGVESDEDVKRVYFQCPKIVEEDIDLSEFTIFVNYQNANENKETYVCDDMMLSGDNITFSWVVARSVLIKNGQIKFSMCAKKLDIDGTILQEWNTTPAYSNCLIGLEADTQPPDNAPDILAQISEIAVQAKNAGEAAQEAANKANGIVDSIENAINGTLLNDIRPSGTTTYSSNKIESDFMKNTEMIAITEAEIDQIIA